MAASETEQRALLHVLQMVILFVRANSANRGRLSDRHLFDLMDAVHNVPEAFTGSWFTEEMIRDRFADYEETWGADALGLVRLLDEGLKRARGG